MSPMRLLLLLILTALAPVAGKLESSRTTVLGGAEARSTSDYNGKG